MAVARQVARVPQRRRSLQSGRRAATRLPAGSLPEPIWADFGSYSWERQATVLRRVLPGPLVSSDRLFAALARAAERFRAGDPLAEFALWVNARKLNEIAML